jgi:hypothetical protein
MLTMARFGWGNGFFGLAAVLLVPLAYAEPKVFIEIIEVKCGKGPVTAPELSYPGIPNVTYEAEMLGLRIKGVPGIVETEGEFFGTGAEMRASPYAKVSGHEDLESRVRATCFPGEVNGSISYTGATQSCPEGKGITLCLTRPNCPVTNPNQYSAVVKLTTTWRDEGDYDRAQRQKEIEAELAKVAEEQALLERQLDTAMDRLIDPAQEAWRRSVNENYQQEGNGYQRYPGTGYGGGNSSSSCCCNIL